MRGGNLKACTCGSENFVISRLRRNFAFAKSGHEPIAPNHLRFRTVGPFFGLLPSNTSLNFHGLQVHNPVPIYHHYYLKP